MYYPVFGIPDGFIYGKTIPVFSENKFNYNPVFSYFMGQESADR